MTAYSRRFCKARDAKGTAKDGPELTQKSFFMVFFTGGVLGDKVSKIATYFGATLYKYPDLPGEHARMVVEVDRRLTESSEVLARSTAILNNALQRCAHDYALWTHVVGREKMVYDALNNEQLWYDDESLPGAIKVCFLRLYDSSLERKGRELDRQRALLEADGTTDNLTLAKIVQQRLELERERQKLIEHLREVL